MIENCRRRARVRFLAALASSAAGVSITPAPTRAQQIAARYDWTMPPGYREVQLRAQETQRTLLLAMADSMPERWYRDAAAEGQRDFAQQVHHAAAADLYIVSHYVKSEETPFIQDTAATFNSRSGLERFINAAYDYSTRALKDQSDADRSKLIWYFGQKIPRWLVWDELNQHTLWTLGQVVANFRKHGMPPPAFSYY
ncbi:MAG TPA: hypothetical protein VFW66_12300 [Gemmatimonadales bacterium]|nr:hypothetical protein [Gemmatimonadales bacterium]